VVEDPALTAQHPEASPCRITVRLTDGRTVEHALRYPKGHDKSPMSRGEIEEKFRRLFAGYGDAAQAGAVIDAVDGLDRMATVAPLFAAFGRRAA
jgi:2-methylcitrate dehydratase